MATQSSGNISNFSDKLFHDNEIYTNRLASYAIAMLGFLLITMFFLDMTDLYDLGGELMGKFILAAGIFDFLVFITAKVTDYKEVWVKKFVMAAVLFSNGVIFFFYPMVSSFILTGPVMISALYYNRKMILKTSVIAWITYSVLLWANVYLEKRGGAIHDLHAFQGFTIWKYPMDVLRYRFIPNTALFIIAAVICHGITRRGILFVSKQAQASAQIAEVDAELKMASQIQQSTLPAQVFQTEDDKIQIKAFMRPAKVVGGDFYDYFIINTSIIFLVADVSDKGLSAAMFMMRAKNAIRSAFNVCNNLKNAVEIANKKLCKNNSENMFVTMWVGAIDMRTGVGKYVNCGHLSPIVKRKDGEILQLTNSPDLMLGVFEDAEFSDHPLWLKSYDTILVFTDGLTDAVNKSGVSYGNSRLMDTIQNLAKGTYNLCEPVYKAVTDFADGTDQFDDMTALSIAFKEVENPDENTLRMDASSESIEVIIDKVNSLLVENNCPEETRRNIDVAIDEVCGNIVDYAYPESKGELEAYIRVGKNFIRMIITDDGIPFNPLESEDPDIGGEPSVGGLGIFLVKNIMDGVKYSRVEEKNQIVLFKIWNM